MIFPGRFFVGAREELFALTDFFYYLIVDFRKQ
jgi:hypothetical protein